MEPNIQEAMKDSDQLEMGMIKLLYDLKNEALGEALHLSGFGVEYDDSDFEHDASEIERNTKESLAMGKLMAVMDKMETHNPSPYITETITFIRDNITFELEGCGIKHIDIFPDETLDEYVESIKAIMTRAKRFTKRHKQGKVNLDPSFEHDTNALFNSISAIKHGGDESIMAESILLLKDFRKQLKAVGIGVKK